MSRIAACAGIVLVLVVGAVAVANDQVPGRTPEGPVLLRGGDLYTVSHGVLPATDLLFDDGTIRAIGVGLAAPADALVLDVRGQRVYPGLIVTQAVLGLTEIGAVRATNDLDEVGDVTPEAAAHVAYNPDSELIPTVRAHGLTTAQIVPSGSLIRGRPFLTHLDGWTKEDAGIRLTHGLQVSWPSVSARRGRRDADPRRQAEARERARQELERAFRDARAYLRARAADPSLPVDVRWEAMRGVLEDGEPLFVQADDYRQIVEAVAFAEEHGLKMVLTGAAEADRAVDLLREHDIPVIVGATQRLPQRVDDGYDAPFRLPAVLHEAGVRVALTLISRGGWSVRNLPFQASQAIAFGLPEDVALRALTLTPAEILGIDDLEGSLDVGKRATLFVSEGDALDVTGQRVTYVFIEGRPVDLDNRHRQLERKYRQKPGIAAP